MVPIKFFPPKTSRFIDFSSLDLTALAQALDSEQGHTSFGKLPLSVEKTAGCFSFPVAKRDD